MASSKPKIKMLYLKMDKNFGKMQLSLIENIVLYDKKSYKTIPHSTKYSNKIIVTVETSMSPKEFIYFAEKKISNFFVYLQFYFQFT